jgi:hypothetical protein
MNIEFPYLIIAFLLLLLGAFYLSPYELSVNEDDDEE